MRFARLVLSNFKRHRLRTLLTTLSIVVAFILFAYLSAIKKGFEMGVTMAGADRLIVRNKISLIQPLPQSYQAKINSTDGVAISSQASWFGGIYRDEKFPFAQIAVEPAKFMVIYPEFVLPPEQKEAWTRTRTSAILAGHGWPISTERRSRAPAT